MKQISSLVILLLLVAAWLTWPASPAAAQSDGLTMTAEASFDGNFKYGEWLPVRVELANQGGDLEAEVRIPVSGSQGTTIFSAPVSLPSGSRKLVTLYTLPNNFSRQLEVQLVDDEGNILLKEEVSVRPQPNITYQAGLLAPERGALSLINGVRFAGQERPKVIVDLSLDELPEKAEALRSFDLLVINDTDTAQMTPEQASALAGWVQQGGALVIGGGAGAQRVFSGLPTELLPARLTGAVEINQAGLQPLAALTGVPLTPDGSFIVAQSEPGDSQVRAGDPSLPLIVTRAFGGGQVIFSALDLAGLPFNGWPGTQAVWEALIGLTGRYPDNMPYDMSPRQYRANTLLYPLSNIPSLDLPSIKGLSILLVIYIIIVGPVNYLVLRRLRRMNLAWVTIPVLTVLFAAASFTIGYTMRGNDLVLNKISLIQAQADGGGRRADAAITTYMGLFSPRQQSYEVTVDGQGLVSPMTGYDQGPWGQGGVSTSGGQMVFEQGQPARVQGLTVNQWSMQSFMSEGVWPDFGSITGDLYLEDDVLKGVIRNDTGYPLTDVVLTMQNRFVRLGDLGSGEEKTVDLGLSSLQNERFGPPLSYRIYQENVTGVIPREIELKTNIVGSVFENTPWVKTMNGMAVPGGSAPYSGVLVLGWLDQAPPNVTVPGSTLSQKTTALVYNALDYKIPQSGRLSLPAGLIPGGVTKLPQEGGTCGPNSVHISRGQAEFEFMVPQNMGDLAVTTLKLAIWRDSGGQEAIPAFSLYDWEDASWTSIQDPIQGTNVINNAAPFVNDQGVVRVQVSSDQDTFGCIYLDLGLEAEREARQEG